MRGRGGRFVSTAAPLARFVSKCEFDPTTGCVVWTGGRTQGQGHSVPYGSFWFEGRRWFAHRWAAKHIHGLDIDQLGTQVDHNCRNTLCVQHLQVVSATVNRELQWIRVQVGCDPYTPDAPLEGDVPFFIEPDWLKGNKR